MHRVLALTILALAATVTVPAQTAVTEDEVRRFLAEHEQAMVARDVPFMERVVTEDWTYRTTPAASPDGEPRLDRGISTMVLEKRGGEWKVITEHESERRDRTCTQPAAPAVAELEAALTAAYDSRSRDALERLITPDFVSIHADGRVDSKERWITSAAAGSLMFQRGEREEYDPELRTPAGGTAVRTARLLLRLPEQGVGLWMRRTWMYVCADASWRLAFMQSTLLHEEPQGVDVSVFDDYAGEYEIEPGRRVTVRRNRSELVVVMPEGPAQAFQTARDAFRLSRTSSVRFERDADGRVAAVVLTRAGREVWRAVRSPL